LGVLCSQRYPADLYTLIVADNNSACGGASVEAAIVGRASLVGGQMLVTVSNEEELTAAEDFEKVFAFNKRGELGTNFCANGFGSITNTSH
jgi:hypothetical protein